MEFTRSEQASHFFSKLDSSINFNMFLEASVVNDIFGFENTTVSEIAMRLGFKSDFAVVNNSAVYMALLGLLLIACTLKLLNLVIG